MAIFILSACSGFGATYYLSNSGNDANSGTSPAEAWQTISHLNTVVLAPGDSVLFESGSIFRGEIVLTSGGTAGNEIYFGRYGTGDLPVISGAEEVTGWSLYSGNVYDASFAGPASQLFADDRLMTLARYPNHGYLFQQGATSDTSFLDSSLNQETNFWKGATVRMRMNDLAWENRPVDSSSASEIFVQYPFIYSILSGYGYYFDNLLSLLDTAEEWYYSSAGEIFFYSPSGNDPSSINVEASKYFYGLKILNGVSFISVENLQFEKQELSGIILVSASNNIRVLNCSFRQQGENGIEIPAGGSQVDITGNTFDGCLSIGVKEQFVDTSSIINNYFKNIGMLPGYGFANVLNGFPIVIDESDSIFISENNTDSSGNGGVSLAASNCVIDKNIFRNTFLVANHGGVISNVSALNQYNVFTDNFVFSPQGNNDATPGNILYSSGITLSDSCEGCRLQHNSVIEASGSGIFLGSGSEGYSLSNNLVYGCRESQIKFDDPGILISSSNNDVKQNVFYALGEDQSIVQLQSSSLSSMPAEFDSNYYFNPYDYFAVRHVVFADSDLTNFVYSLAQWQIATNGDQHSKSTFFYRNRYTVIDSLGPELVVNGNFTNNLDNWSVGVPGNIIMLLDNSTPLDFGCMKLVKTDTLPFREGGVLSSSLKTDSGAFYKINVSDYSTREGSIHLVLLAIDSLYANLGLDRHFPFYNYRQNYETIFQAPKSDEHAQLQVLITYKDSLAWVDNISISQVTVQYHDPHQLSRLFLNPTEFPVTFDLGDSLFFDLDQNPVSNSLTLQPYSSIVLIYDSSLILNIDAPEITSSFKVFPNPALSGSEITIVKNDRQSRETTVELIDIMGKVIQTEKFGNKDSAFQFRLPQNIAAGMYMIVLLSDQQQSQAKILIE